MLHRLIPRGLLHGIGNRNVLNRVTSWKIKTACYNTKANCKSCKRLVEKFNFVSKRFEDTKDTILRPIWLFYVIGIPLSGLLLAGEIITDIVTDSRDAS